MPFNTEIEECQALLHYLITEANKINKSIKWILTVSPVPLAATHTSQHVLVANTISKSTLRLVAQYAANKFSNVFYFPSYEIVDGLKQQGSYFSSNARDVENRGVGHAMRVFSKHFLKDDIIDKNQKLNLEKEFQRQRNIQCDEDTVFNL